MLKNKATLTPESSFSRPPAGFSLAGTPGQWPWERPPKYATAEQAVDALIDNLEKPEIQEMHIQLLAAGVSIEEIVTTTSRVGFMEGMFTVDVGELIKGPLAIYFMGLAVDAGIDANVFATRDGLPRTNYGMKDSVILNIMRDRNPDFAKYVTTRLPREESMRLDQERMMQEQSFLGMDSPDVIEGEMVEEPVEMPEDEMGEEGMIPRPSAGVVEGEQE